MAIERKFIKQNMKELLIKEHVETSLSRVGLAGVKLRKTPLGDRIVVSASRPGLVVGRQGANISRLTKELKENFTLDNPQIEIEEVTQPDLDPNIIAERIINSLERFGSARFKGIGHRSMADVMAAGALGVEITINGKVPSTRAKNWRFYTGYLKKCGDFAIEGVRRATKAAILKTGVIGVQVRIMPADIELPDNAKILPDPVVEVEEKPLSEAEERALVTEAEAATEVAADAEAASVVEAAETVAAAEEKPKKAAAKKKTAAKRTAKKAASADAAPAAQEEEDTTTQ